MADDSTKRDQAVTPSNVRRGKARQSGMGLKLAALEALQVGGIVEFGERKTGTWRVRLAVPLDRT